ncbi:hypothetical protein MMC27_004562 [Xylographa pallens]|nr:hypothetical protein [Xylographa pallens]
MLVQGSFGSDNSPPPAAPRVQRPSTENPSVWQAQPEKRMENVDPNAPDTPNRNVVNQQPVPNPHLPHPEPVENLGVPGVNLPCGWLDGSENTDGETGVESDTFRLDPGRYVLHVRWTRTPHFASVNAHVNLIDMNSVYDPEPWDTVFFPGTRLPWTVIAYPPRGSEFFLDLRRKRTDADPPRGNLLNDAAVIWWFDRQPDDDAGAAASGSGARRRPAEPMDEGVETPAQRPRLNP